MVNVAILGCTGSIGVQTLSVLQRHSDKFRASVLVAGSNVELLKKQYEIFKPDYVGIYDTKYVSEVYKFVPRNRVVTGKDALIFAATLKETDIIVMAISGMIGLYAVDAAIKNDKKIALAGKESLVAGGEYVNSLLKKHKSEIIPVDSEHSAIMQCLAAGRREDVKRIILTASGGPFYGKSKEMLKAVTVEQAIKHPTWKMGKKISVDSATMMNKALEIIEARYLFDTSKIDYIVHPESIVHSMVEYVDGAVIAQLGRPSMEIPIQYALSIPARYGTDIESVNLTKLTFSEPDEINFPAPKLAKYCIDKGLDYACCFNAANEAAVSLFMEKTIGFTDIYDIVESVVTTHKPAEQKTIDDLFDCYKLVSERVYEIVKKKEKN